MHLRDNRNPWRLSYGFNMKVDFCIWVLEIDGLCVPPFDQHPDGDHSLRDLGLRAQTWLKWLLRTVQQEYEFHQQIQASLESKAAQQVMRQALDDPNAGGPGDERLKTRLGELWEKYGPLSDLRRSWELRQSQRWMKAEQRSGRHLYHELRPYSQRIGALIIHLIGYPWPVDCLIPPVTLLMSVNEHQPDGDEFGQRVLKAAAGLADRTGNRPRLPDQFQRSQITTVPIIFSATYEPKSAPPSPGRKKSSVVAQDGCQQAILDWLGGKERQSSADLSTIRFLYTKSIPGWRLQYVRFRDIDGEIQDRCFILKQDEQLGWRVDSASTDQRLRNVLPQLLPLIGKVRDHPQIFLGLLGGSGFDEQGHQYYQFTSDGEVVDNGFGVRRVRLIAPGGQIFEDSVEDGLVFFAAQGREEIKRPMQAELYDGTGKLVWSQPVFEEIPRFFL